MAKKAKSKRIYRERSPLALFLKALGIILLSLVVLSLMIFFWFQRYVVYDSNGATLRVPFLQFLYEDDEEGPVSPKVPLVIETPDVSITEETGAVTEGSVLTAIKVPELGSVDAETYIAQMTDVGANGILVEMKNISGQLMYLSENQTVKDYEITVGPEVSDITRALKDNGVYLIANICCFADNTLALRSPSSALQDESGATYVDENQTTWLNPENKTTIDYLTDICSELITLGFDEILLNNFEVPTAPTPEEELSILSAFISKLRDRTKETKLSVVCGGDMWTDERANMVSDYANMAYRLYTYQSDSETAQTIARQVLGDSYSERFVVIGASGGVEGMGRVISE